MRGRPIPHPPRRRIGVLVHGGAPRGVRTGLPLVWSVSAGASIVGFFPGGFQGVPGWRTSLEMRQTRLGSTWTAPGKTPGDVTRPAPNLDRASRAVASPPVLGSGRVHRRGWSPPARVPAKPVDADRRGSPMSNGQAHVEPRTRSLTGGQILGPGSYVPHNVISHHDQRESHGFDPEWIVNRTGISRAAGSPCPTRPRATSAPTPPSAA